MVVQYIQQFMSSMDVTGTNALCLTPPYFHTVLTLKQRYCVYHYTEWTPLLWADFVMPMAVQVQYTHSGGYPHLVTVLRVRGNWWAMHSFSLNGEFKVSHRVGGGGE